MRGLMCSLIEYQTITTTLSRCKETRRELEKLITIARKGGLANRRIVISRLNDLGVANLLVDVVAPQIKRDSGYLRIERAGFRHGDNAEMGTISFVDEIDFDAGVTNDAKTATKKSEVKSEKAKAKAAKKEDK